MNILGVVILVSVLVAIVVGKLVLRYPWFHDRVWKRHYNPWSWYARFFFAFVLYAGIWAHSVPLIAVTLLCLATCQFWFPEPRNKDTFIAHAVHGEVLWMKSKWTTSTAVFLAAVFAAFCVAVYALWSHHLLWAVTLIGFLTLYKLLYLKTLADLSRATGQKL